MKIYGLSGKSGTGKSYSAAELCGRLDIDGIIDDGIFVHNNAMIAGTSAKQQPTKYGAIKTALFTKDEHCDEVKAAIRRVAPDSILVLGTSDEMVLRIIRRLGLPEPEHIIHIEDITTEEQRELALRTRASAGTHVIPAPTFQVKKQFSGLFFLDPKKAFREAGRERPDAAGSKSIVRPTYSYLGDFEISDKLINDIVLHDAAALPGISSVLFVTSQNEESGMYIRIILLVNFGSRAMDTAAALQAAVERDIEGMTAFNVLGVEVEIRGFRFKQ